MDKFLEMLTFKSVVDAGSFVGATNGLHMSKAAVSRYVAELEARLGVRLLNRTTRRLSLTDDGEVFYARCTELLSGIDEAESEVTSRSAEAVGGLRVTVPVSLGILHLVELWGRFKQLHPKVTIDVTLSDRVVDLVDEGFDLAIRIATLPSSSLISRKLTSTRMVLCASPEYLKRAGAPMQPGDLAQHSVLSFSYWSTGDDWSFAGPAGPVSVTTHPCIRRTVAPSAAPGLCSTKESSFSRPLSLGPTWNQAHWWSCCPNTVRVNSASMRSMPVVTMFHRRYAYSSTCWSSGSRCRGGATSVLNEQMIGS